ncbi:PIN-like domain-containing protein [Glaesserella parasuis]|uniref:PIN-like domain-containing protein n=2 Tax=Glaesserella parasuis TaxID=738 RepID=UPI00132B6ED1|nr:PIN-like domain-containing protein [Glaesserella parasuis]MDG6336335.1 PIN-like domain-containing protein [Glaesserella parasuis]MDG6429464.1 PIN-like domain-containing protein [Glaesserella parasuis]MDG6446989.1 PIN-like domain-containing protein [Glaesserella parasuis]MDG6776956.1 PIN-like domain-containing protein [Glaesserella parasuis]MDG6819503.1 PIN-like domain-containing protein [Glaesserella parasuis]
MASIKDEFGWAIPLTKEEINDIWNKAILTVDTNVLLDLYRYHPKTRNSILNSFRMFENRLWLSHQVVKEFFKNRTTVISDARKDFDNGKNIINALPVSLNKHIDELIKSNRTVSKDLIDKIKNKLSETINEIVKNENDESEKVSYLNDEIINKILQYFENNIGDKFREEELEKILKMAEDRFAKKIPPGYKDENTKQGNSKYGDFFVWEQILRHGELTKLPIILITSERKEDWWEIKSGETIGLRSELKQEAWDRLQQHILVYQTENFLSIVAEKESETKIVEEINDAIKEVKQLNVEKEIIGLRKFTKSQIVNKVEQSIEFNTEYTNIGYISCYIGYPTKYFTVSGQLEPRLKNIPTLHVELLDSPKEYFVEPHASTGTKHDFNIHMKSRDIVFDIGTYVFKYHAYVEKEDLGSHYYEELVVPCPSCGGDYLLDINQCCECEYESIRECQLCHNEINGHELDFAPYCSYCTYKMNKND